MFMGSNRSLKRNEYQGFSLGLRRLFENPASPEELSRLYLTSLPENCGDPDLHILLG
jgi:hypothetical protein